MEAFEVGCFGPFGAACPGFKVSSSPIPPFSIERPPRSVSSGCHNSPATVFGPPLDSEVPGRGGLEDAFVSERTRLLRYLERRAGQDAAPDLVQEVFVRAFGSANARRLVNPAAFLQRIARNLLIDRARKRARDNVVFFPFEEQRDSASPAEQEWPKRGAKSLAKGDVLVCASASKGGKSAGYSAPTDGSVRRDQLAFKPENLYAYEVGLKSQFLDRRLTFNTSAYYYDYKDFQTFQFSGVTSVSPKPQCHGLWRQGRTDRASRSWIQRQSRLGRWISAYLNNAFDEHYQVSAFDLTSLRYSFRGYE